MALHASLRQGRRAPKSGPSPSKAATAPPPAPVSQLVAAAVHSGFCRGSCARGGWARRHRGRGSGRTGVSAAGRPHSPQQQGRGRQQLLGQVEPGSRAGSTRPQLLQPKAVSLINKTDSSPLAARGGWRAWGRPGPGPSPSPSCPLSPGEAQQRQGEATAPEGSRERCPGVMGAKRNSPGEGPGVALEEREGEGEPVFFSVRGRTGGLEGQGGGEGDATL